MARSLLTHTPVQQALSIGLGVFAVALVFGLLLYASSNPAGADNSPPLTDDIKVVENRGGVTPTPTPKVHATPEACPTNPDDVVSEGHYALFEVYWDPDDDDADGRNLTGNPCPPIVRHVKHTHTENGKEVITWTAQRSAPTFKVSDSKHDVISTLHVNETKKQSLAASVNRYFITVKGEKKESNSAGVAYTEQNKRPEDDLDRYYFAYPELDDPSDETTVGTLTTKTYNRKDEFGANIWALPYCEPEDNYYTPVAGDLCLGFSAGLLDPSDWIEDPEAEPVANGRIQYHLESIREPGLNVADRGYVFIYYPYDVDEDEDGNAVEDNSRVTWQTDETNSNHLKITPGTYQHRNWAFSKPGRYQLQVHALGYPSNDLKREAGIRRISTTSVVRFYNFHVGLMADLSIEVSADDAAPDPGDTVTLTVKATNAGPDMATATKVDVDLPTGLTFVSATPNDGDGTYNSETGVWTIGDMAAPTTTTENGETITTNATATLIIKATVDAETHGQALTTDAEIYATETIGSSTLLELDPDATNNKGSETVTVTTIPNVDPMFHFMRFVNEDAGPGGWVGRVIYAAEPDSDDTLTYTLGGDDAAKFDLWTKTDGSVQVVVADNAYLNYEDKDANAAKLYYDVTLSVSDGKDQYGNDDASVDQTVAVRVDVADVTEAQSISAHLVPGGDELTVTYDDLTGLPQSYSATVGSTVTMYTVLGAAPLATNAMTYSWSAGGASLTGSGVNQDVTAASAGTVTYQVTIAPKDTNSNVTGTTASLPITWTAASTD